MNERPILFTSENVLAILEKRKTHTRRVIKPQPNGINTDGKQFRKIEVDHWDENLQHSLLTTHKETKCPYGQPGDRLWVRETWGIFQEDWTDYGWEPEGMIKPHIPKNERDLINNRFTKQYPVYKATFDPDEKGYWYPSIFLPRWASRITLEIVNIRVERVQEISGIDAIAEGIDALNESGKFTDPDYMIEQIAKRKFRELWDSINAKRGYGWDVNPWVRVIEFKML